MDKRAVITGMGVVSPNGIGIKEFLNSLVKSISGIKKVEELTESNFRCQIGGICKIDELLLKQRFPVLDIPIISRSTLLLVQATIEAIESANLKIDTDLFLKLNPAIIIGSTIGPADLWGEKIIPLTNKSQHVRLGSYAFEQIINSSPASMLSGILGTTNRVISSSLACASSTEAIAESYNRIKRGESKLIIAGGVEPYSKYYWATMDAMKIINPKHNDVPEKGSRPMSESARGFVPAEASGILIIEEYEHAIKRKAPILAEIVGENVNCGGQKNGGSMTASNYRELKNCLSSAIKSANIVPSKIDFISGHLTGTKADPFEIKVWKEVLNCSAKDFPHINSTKSLIGHSIGACGAVETIASILQMNNNFIHASVNCEDIHPEIEKTISKDKIAFKRIDNIEINYIAKANFGFGDVNACIILKKCNEK
ncbi:MAG TPA: beta-ketoacyl-[acyl-carrier-protein] synthase family protein [Bacteroidales bacterium]|nr:beta-ketoacyl-[acyl-carrier-protein] synthase family protein [Bacteroidales bacterium]